MNKNWIFEAGTEKSLQKAMQAKKLVGSKVNLWTPQKSFRVTTQILRAYPQGTRWSLAIETGARVQEFFLAMEEAQVEQLYVNMELPDGVLFFECAELNEQSEDKYLLPVPEKFFWVQRREDQRVLLPKLCSWTLQIENWALVLVDLSRQGAKVYWAESMPAPQVEQQWQGILNILHMSHPVQAQIRHIRPLNEQECKHRVGWTHAVGLRWLDAPSDVLQQSLSLFKWPL